MNFIWAARQRLPILWEFRPRGIKFLPPDRWVLVGPVGTAGFG